MKRDAIEVNHCLRQKSPFDVRNFFSVLATLLSDVVLNVLSRFANILLGKRELAQLCSCCRVGVCILCLFLVAWWVAL